MLILYVDADSCPVKDEALRVAERHNLDVYLVSNGGGRPDPNPKVHIIKVDAGADVADDWIAERAGENDIVITNDILLAQRCILNKVLVLKPNGGVFSDDNIGQAVAGRSISNHLRELGESGGHNAAFSSKDRSQFLQVLQETIMKVKRS
jgi:uncharacterized protein YaiI (UPF0178 family)